MNKVKSAFSGGASKLEGITGVFGRHRSGGSGGGNDLQRLSNAAEAERQASIRARGESTIDRIHIVIHSAAIFFTFLAICLTAAVAGFQAKWVGVSGGTGFVLFLLLLAFVLSCTLLAIPIAYDRWDKCRRPAQFLSQPRAAVILNIFGGFLMITAAIISSAAGFGAYCKDLGASTTSSSDSSSSSGSSNTRRADSSDTSTGTTSSETTDMSGYVAGFASWCRTRRAAAMFAWFAFFCWLGLAVFAGLAFRRERQSARRRENAFIPPEDGETGPYGDGVVDDVFADKHEAPPASAPAAAQPLVSQPHPMSPTNRPLRTGYGHVQNADSAMARPSVDAYGAFDGDMPGSEHREQPSRTMQMAYADPYDQIRQNVLNDGYAQPPPPPPHQPVYGHVPPPAPQPYGQPPSYGGY